MPGRSPQEQRQGGGLGRLEGDKDLKQSTRRLLSLMLGGCPEVGLGVIQGPWGVPGGSSHLALMAVLSGLMIREEE